MYIDLTKQIYTRMPVYPGDPEVLLKPIATVDQDGYSNYELHTSMHVSTHVETPAHMKPTNHRLLSYGLDDLIGLGRKISVHEQYDYLGEEIILIDTKSPLNIDWIKSVTQYPIKAIVLEIESPDVYPYDIHHYLFDKGILIVENATNFDQLPKHKIFKTFIIPLKIDTDACPCRLFVEI